MSAAGRRVTVIGDVLLDRDVEGRVDRLCPDAPVPVVDETGRRSRPGGAGLAAALAAADGNQVTLVTALANDAAGRELGALLSEAGVEVADLGCEGTTPEKIRITNGGRTLLRLDRGSGAPCALETLPRAAHDALEEADAILVSDYGRGVAAISVIRSALADLAPTTPVVWDPHPKGAEPVPGARLATPNRSEAARFAPGTGAEGGVFTVARERAETLAGRWHARGVTVTLGAEGALLVGDGVEPLVVPSPEAAGGDPCGAGDRFASRAAGLLAGGASLADAVAGAVRAASAFVAAGGAASFRTGSAITGPVEAAGGPEDTVQLARRVRAHGGTVVVTGGCFDLLHAGHVSMLKAARQLGDCLIVCLNSDESVRRLKGPDRPIVPEEERAAVLKAMECVDAVVTFGEDTPVAALESLRPHLFVKGGDYEGCELPEALVLARWGGEAVILPYIEGRSTTRLIQEAIDRFR